MFGGSGVAQWAVADTVLYVGVSLLICEYYSFENLFKTLQEGKFIRIHEFISSDRSSCTDDGLLSIYPRQLFQIVTQSLDAIDVTSVTLSRFNSINAIDVTR